MAWFRPNMSLQNETMLNVLVHMPIVHVLQALILLSYLNIPFMAITGLCDWRGWNNERSSGDIPRV